MSYSVKGILVVSLLSLTACGATYEKDTHLPTTINRVKDRTGFELTRQNLENGPAAPLSGALSPEDAARAALQYNVGLQAALEDLNIATADEVQAGLLINPSFEGEFVFEGGRTLLDFTLALDITRILTRSARVRAAKAERAALELAVTDTIVRTMFDAKRATLSLWRAENLERLYAEQTIVAQSADETATILDEAGNFTLGMRAMYQGMLDYAAVEQGAAGLQLLDARTALANITGTPLSPDVSSAIAISKVSLDMTEDAFIAQVLERHLGLASQRQAFEALGAELGLAKISAWIDHIELAAVFEREEESAGGFEIGIPIPIFDWGQVRTGRAQAVIDAASYRYQALYLMVRNRAQSLHRYVTTLKGANDRFSGSYLQASEDEYTFAHQQLNAMQIGPLGLLSARRRQLDQQMRILEIQYRYADAVLSAQALLAGVEVALEPISASGLDDDDDFSGEGDH